MSTGGYDGLQMSSDFARQQPRPPIRSGIPNRLPVVPPPSSRMSYDRRHAPDLALREGMSGGSRPNTYRPDYSSGKYYARSPSPDPYPLSSRLPESDSWNRGNSWRPPPQPLDVPNSWPERKTTPLSPTNSSLGRGPRDDVPSRSFEPSASWVNSRGDRSARSDHSPPTDYGRRGKGSLERSPERPMRTERPPVFTGGDRYVPAYNSARRDSVSTPRHGYESYRPPPSDHGWTAPARREPSPSSSHRRDSGSYSAKAVSRHDSPRSGPAVSKKASPAPLPANPYTRSASAQSRPASESWSFVTRAKHSLPPRPQSRSSIASTQVSERKSPVHTPIPPPFIAPTPIPTLATPLLKEATPKEVPSAAKGSEYSMKASELPPASSRRTISVEQALTQKENERSIPEKNDMALDNKADPDVSIIPSSLSPTGKQLSADSKISTVAPEKVPDEPMPHIEFQREDSPEAMDIETPDEQSGSPPSRPMSMSPLIIPAASPAPQAFTEEKEPNKIVEPQPVYPTPPRNHVEMTPPIDIPPPTHSPILSEHSHEASDSRRASPVITAVDVPRPEEIPPIHDLKTAEDALRMLVMRRLVFDRQSREQRINPVIMANVAIAAPMEVHPYATPETLLEKMSTGKALEEKMESFICTRPKLASYLRQRHTMVEEKIARLRREYKTLQERWEIHCNNLNDQQKSLATEHEMQHGGRTTRRSTAITDAVRSDFEMEQIIASLGVDDATDPNCLSAKNTAKIPDMISVVNGQIDFVFDDTAHRVDNPAEYYAPKTGIHDWTDAEKRIFIEKFAAHPKQFGIIADFIENKTAAQCVDYYYLHKNKFIDFRKIVQQFAGNKRRRRGTGKKKGNGLLVDIAIHDMEVRGAGGVAGSPKSASVVTRAPRGRKTVAPPDQRKPSSRRTAVQFEDTPTSTQTPEPETRTRRRRTVPSTPLASTPVVASPTPEPSMPPGGYLMQDDNLDYLDTRPTKRARRTRKIKSVAVIGDDNSPAPEAPSGPTRGGRKERGPAVWTDEDKKTFVKLLAQHGDNFKRIAECMPTKTQVQCSNYFANHKYELGFDTIISKASSGDSPSAETHSRSGADSNRIKAPSAQKRSTYNQPTYTDSGSLQPAFKQTSRPKAGSSNSNSTMSRFPASASTSGYPFIHHSGDFQDDGPGFLYTTSPNVPKNPTYAAMYPPSATPAEVRAGYRPTTPVSNDTPNIVHSPTGMSPPRPAPPPIPTMTQSYMAPHMHYGDASQHHAGYYNTVPVANPNWPVQQQQQQQRYYDPVYVSVGNGIRTSAGTGASTSTAGGGTGAGGGGGSGSGEVQHRANVADAYQQQQRPSGNPYPTYPPPSAHTHAHAAARMQTTLPPPPVPYPPHPVSGSTRPPTQYYPGWTAMQ